MICLDIIEKGNKGYKRKSAYSNINPTCTIQQGIEKLYNVSHVSVNDEGYLCLVYFSTLCAAVNKSEEAAHAKKAMWERLHCSSKISKERKYDVTPRKTPAKRNRVFSPSMRLPSPKCGKPTPKVKIEDPTY